MTILLLNRFSAESGAPTGRLLGELADRFAWSGHTVRVLTEGGTYGVRKNGWRWGAELICHLSFLLRGCVTPKPDVVISMTSPACLLLTAEWIARWHRAKHVHWAMDLYPEVALRLGEIREGFVFRLLHHVMTWAYSRLDRLVVLDEDMQAHVQRKYRARPVIIGPSPPPVAWPHETEKTTKEGRWLYSGNFGRAHEIDVLLQVQAELEARHVEVDLVLQGHGPQFCKSQAAALQLGLRRVSWKEPCPIEELGNSLLQSDVLVVTRQADLKGLLLPSKLVLAELSGRPILWIGDIDGTTAQRLRLTNRHGVFRVEDVSAIAQWLQDCLRDAPTKRAVSPTDTAASRETMLAQWERLLRAL